MNQVMQGLPCTIFGDGTQSRAFTHISDVAPLIAASVYEPKAWGQVFNIGAEAPCTVNELAEAVQQAIGRRTGVKYLEGRKEVLHAYSDHSKLRRVLGYEPGVPIREGLERMAAWALSVGPRLPKTFEAIEIEKNLPSAWWGVCTKG